MLLLLLACSAFNDTAPGTRESVCDGLDDDGDGWVDEGAVIVQARPFDSSLSGWPITRIDTVYLESRSVLPGVHTVTTVTVSGDGEFEGSSELVYDLQGRLVQQRFETPAGDTLWVLEVETSWGDYGLQTIQWERRHWNSEDELLSEELGTGEAEYDALGRNTRWTEQVNETCHSKRYDWDDLAYTRSDWLDEGCTGEWVENGGVQFDEIGRPLYDLGKPDGVYQWDGDLYLGYADTNYSEWNTYEQGLLVHSEQTFLHEPYAEAWADYDDQGRLVEHRYWTTTEETRTTYTLNAVGGLVDELSWRLDTDEAHLRSYVSDAHLNITQTIDEDGLTSTTTFDCHPPQ
ncbi:MAG: hypothetical protein VX899_07350 [Myxococcota bacterium]|nr:hypothetical protein [Myxococcota bacterium]